MTFEGLTNAIKATQNQDDTFTIRVDKSLLDKKTQKNLIKIRIKDSNNRENWRTFQITVDVTFEDKTEKAEKEAQEI